MRFYCFSFNKNVAHNGLFQTIHCMIYGLAILSMMQFSYSQDTLPFFDKSELNIRFNGILQDGNVQRQLFTFQSNTTLHSSIFESETQLRYNYGSQNRQIAENDILFTTNCVVYPDNIVAGVLFGTVERSRLRKIDFRWQTGIGAKIHIFNQPQNRLTFSNILLLDVTNFPDTTRQSARLSLRLKGTHTFFTNKIRCMHETLLQPSINRIADARWRTQITLEFPLTKLIALNTTFANSFESIVLENRKQNDLAWTFGVTVTIQ